MNRNTLLIKLLGSESANRFGYAFFYILLDIKLKLCTHLETWMTFYNFKFHNNWNNCVRMGGNLVNRNTLLIKLSGSEIENRFGYAFFYILLGIKLKLCTQLETWMTFYNSKFQNNWNNCIGIS